MESNNTEAEVVEQPNLPVEFKFENHPIRTFLNNGTPSFAATDVCGVLEHTNPSKATAGLDDDEKGMHIVHTPGGDQNILTVTESGLYSLIFTSRKPEAKRFRRWITHEVLPSIRKTGTYEARPQDALSDREIRTDHLNAEGHDRFDEIYARIEPTTPNQKFEWIKGMLITPGRYRITVLSDGNTTAYRSSFNVMLDEFDQASVRVLGLMLEIIEARWEQFRLQQAAYDQIYKNCNVVKALEHEIQHGANTARHILKTLDAEAS